MHIIYLIESLNDDTQYYKIGYSSKRAFKRLKTLDTGNPIEMKILYEFETKHNRKLETALHNIYSYCNQKLEWYKLELEDVVNFIPLCEKYEKGFDALKKSDNPFFNKNKNKK